MLDNQEYNCLKNSGAILDSLADILFDVLKFLIINKLDMSSLIICKVVLLRHRQFIVNINAYFIRK